MKISIQEFNQVLEKINDDQKECIVSFLKSCDLVNWLKTALPGNTCLFVFSKYVNNTFEGAISPIYQSFHLLYMHAMI